MSILNLAHRYTLQATVIRNVEETAYLYEHAWEYYDLRVQPVLQRVGQLIGAGCVPLHTVERSITEPTLYIHAAHDEHYPFQIRVYSLLGAAEELQTLRDIQEYCYLEVREFKRMGMQTFHEDDIPTDDSWEDQIPF